MTLERILQKQGFGTRKACRLLTRAGAVEVNGVTCTDPFSEFPTKKLELCVEGELWEVHDQAYLMLNKPTGYECSQRPLHHPSVFNLLPVPLRNRGVQCVGRLDEDTTGLLLFTDDGQFIHRMSSPRWKVPKVYQATTKHSVDDTQIKALLAGVLLHDEPEPIAALDCTVEAPNQLMLTLAEGKYHQVKRMVAAASNRVEKLKRTRIGNLALPPDLAEGAWRWLTSEELNDHLGYRQEKRP